MTNPIADVLKSKVILITGTNTTANHPSIANYIHEAVTKKGAKLVVADPRRIKLVDISHICSLQIYADCIKENCPNRKASDSRYR